MYIHGTSAMEGSFYSVQNGMESLNLAKKASSLGRSTVLGLSGKNHAILVSTSFPENVEVDCNGEQDSIPCKKIVSFDESSMAMSSIGIISDSTYLLEKIFSEMTNHQYLYDTRLQFPRVCKLISKLKYDRTLVKSMRPLGIEEVLIGLDVHGNVTLIHIDTFGNIFHAETCCIGYESRCLLKKFRQMNSMKGALHEKEIPWERIFEMFGGEKLEKSKIEMVILDGLRKRLYSLSGRQLQELLEYSKANDFSESKMEQYFLNF